MKRSSFLEGTIIATICLIITKILGMLYVIPFYAIVGSAGSALYAYAYNIYVIFLDISTAGIPNAMSKIISEYDTLGKKEAKVRTYRIARRILSYIAIASFIVLFFFAKDIAHMIIGDLTGGNTIEDVAFVIRCISFSLLIVPFLSVTKGYLQGHKIINVSSISQVIEQIVRITVIIAGSFIGLKVLNLSLKTSVGIAVFGAFFGGLSALLYILKKMHDNKKYINLDKPLPKDDVTNKEIVKKIANYSIPFIITSIAVSIYSFVDMLLILRSMEWLGYDASMVEFIATSGTTYLGKINMIVTSIAIGMTVSLIPTIVSAYTLKNYKDVEHKYNKALQMISVISIPMVIGISILAKPVWTIFYGANEVGFIILAFGVFTALFHNYYMITISVLQGMSRFKAVYASVLSGFALNAILDIPLIYLFKLLGLPPYLGARMASMLGYTLSAFIGMYILKKDYKLKFNRFFNVTFKALLSGLAMAVVLIAIKYIIPVNLSTKISCILYILLFVVIGAPIYTFVGSKLNIFRATFGNSTVDKVKKKFTFKKAN